MSTHYVGANPDRVVLGSSTATKVATSARPEPTVGFTSIPETQRGTPSLKAFKPQAQALTWQVNEQFLRTQMESGVPRIEYHLPQQFSSVEELMALDANSFSAKEIAFLKSSAEAYGYRQIGNAWVHVMGEQ